MFSNIRFVFLNLRLHDDIVLLRVHALVEEGCAFMVAKLVALVPGLFVLFIFGRRATHFRMDNPLEIGLAQVVIRLRT